MTDAILLAWSAAYGGKTWRNDCLKEIFALHLSSEIDEICVDGLAAEDAPNRASAISRLLVALGEPDPWAEQVQS